VLSLLNEQYIALTGAPFGFVNPLIYTMAAAAPNTFFDVVIGDNICPEGSCGTNCIGWYATQGWDAVTGLGTPNYANMLKYIQTLAKDIVARRKAQGVNKVNFALSY